MRQKKGEIEANTLMLIALRGLESIPNKSTKFCMSLHLHVTKNINLEG